MLRCGSWRIGAGIETANFCAVSLGGIMNFVHKSRERLGFNWVLTLNNLHTAQNDIALISERLKVVQQHYKEPHEH
jgi:hypothetical protein